MITLTTPIVVQAAVAEVTTPKVQIGKIVINPASENRLVSVDVMDEAGNLIILNKNFVAESSANNIVRQIEQYFIARGWIIGTQD